MLCISVLGEGCFLPQVYYAGVLCKADQDLFSHDDFPKKYTSNAGRHLFPQIYTKGETMKISTGMQLKTTYSMYFRGEIESFLEEKEREGSPEL